MLPILWILAIITKKKFPINKKNKRRSSYHLEEATDFKIKMCQPEYLNVVPKNQEM